MTGLLPPRLSGQCDLIEAVGWGVGPQKGGSSGEMPDLDFTVTPRENTETVRMEAPEDREGVGTNPWPPFRFVSSKNTERSPFTIRLMGVPGGVGRQSLETQSELCHFRCLSLSVLREPKQVLSSLSKAKGTSAQKDTNRGLAHIWVLNSRLCDYLVAISGQ